MIFQPKEQVGHINLISSHPPALKIAVWEGRFLFYFSLRVHPQTDFGTLNVIMTLKEEGVQPMTLLIFIKAVIV